MSHDSPLSNDLPDKPKPWNLTYTPFVNDHAERHIDWTVTKREPLGRVSAENKEIAQALATRARAERDARRSRV